MSMAEHDTETNVLLNQKEINKMLKKQMYLIVCL
jgi:hypothetical protein